jgi:hypothetical protein
LLGCRPEVPFAGVADAPLRPPVLHLNALARSNYNRKAIDLVRSTEVLPEA